MNRFTTVALIFALTLTIPACGPEPQAGMVRRGEAAIAWGKPDKGHHEVGSLGGCSSTLIGRKTVLTAAHCVRGGNSVIKFTTKDSVTRSTSVKVHPNYDGDVSDDADIAIIHLEKNVPGVRPATLVKSKLKVGEPLVLVGFGLTDKNQYKGGKKYGGKNRIDALKSKTFHILNEKGAASCPGDSGGPSFALRGEKEYLAGVHSRGSYPPCGTLFGYGIDVRVDVFLAWIKKEAGADLYNGEAIDTVAPKVTITSPADGAVKPHTFTVQASITDNVAVTRAELWLNGTVQMEKTGKSPYTFSLEGLYPVDHKIKVRAYDAELNWSEDEIAIKVKQGKPFGDACIKDANCASGRCLNEPDRAPFCTKKCTADSGCPDGFGCGVDGVCVPLVGESGCVVGQGSSSAWATLGLLVLLLLYARKRRRP